MLNNNGKKIVYVPMVADYLHTGHLNILKTAAELGYVVVGLYTDKATASYKRVPFMSYEQRKAILESVKGVSEVVPQEVRDYEPNLRKYKPHYLVHGTDWRTGPLKGERDRAIAVMAEWGGEVVEPEYTQGISSSDFHEKAKKTGIMAHQRIPLLRKAIEHRPIVRIIESHSGLSAIVAENAKYTQPGRPTAEFDGIWLSSLTDSTVKGKPDTEFVDLSSRIVTLNDILECTTKPIIYDGDTGGRIEHFPLMVRRLERLGVSAVIIEDKTGVKINSLLGNANNLQVMDSIEHFCQKIVAGKKAQISNDFMIIARIESLILGIGQDDALARASAYLDAGADGIMIHSRGDDGQEVFDFCKEYNKLPNRKPLVSVPTNYASVHEDRLRDAGVNIVIYANHLLRSAYSAMEQAAKRILQDGCAAGADESYISALDLVKMIEGNG